MKQVQNDQDDRNDEQGMDPASSTREPWADVPAQKSDQPQHKQDHDNSPNHEISPFELPIGYSSGFWPGSD